RKIGSGNIGATNVLRTGNKGLAAATLLFDALKGTAAVLAGHWLGAFGGYAIVASLLAGMAAFLGHLFPVWLGFKGGKGVATYIGVLIGAGWHLALVFCGVWLLVAVVSRYSSLAALVAAVVTPAVASYFVLPEVGILATLMSFLLVWKHVPNIRRLVAGQEPKIGAKDNA
ncbi:MAG: glycerol-3-phosphate 1-O-acyltransferase PlsY, partial [Hyphomicrobiaceae bacterium]|nr:glycerol-3-phosphate 1-O-acyltransferase PlsY [Hyphomicrobiaceae bacterium]